MLIRFRRRECRGRGRNLQRVRRWCHKRRGRCMVLGAFSEVILDDIGEGWLMTDFIGALVYPRSRNNRRMLDISSSRSFNGQLNLLCHCSFFYDFNKIKPTPPHRLPIPFPNRGSKSSEPSSSTTTTTLPLNQKQQTN